MKSNAAKVALAVPASPASLEVRPFRDNLKHYREAKGMSQSDLARAVFGEAKDDRGNFRSAKGRPRISAYEAGTNLPRQPILVKLAEVLGVRPEQLDPALASRSVDEGHKAFTMEMVQGRPDQVHLRLDTICSLGTAAEIAKLLNKDPHAVAYVK